MKIRGSYPKTRLRRLRKSKWLRNLISENAISKNDLILPIFVQDGKERSTQLNQCLELKDILLMNFQRF